MELCEKVERKKHRTIPLQNPSVFLVIGAESIFFLPVGKLNNGGLCSVRLALKLSRLHSFSRVGYLCSVNTPGSWGGKEGGRSRAALMISPTSWPAFFTPARSWLAVETRTLLVTTRPVASTRPFPWERMSDLTGQQYQGGFSESSPEQPSLAPQAGELIAFSWDLQAFSLDTRSGQGVGAR